MKVGMDHALGGTVIEVQEYLERDLSRKNNNDCPYTIITDETYGRHMVAARDIQVGEIILEDTAVTMGPACSSGILPVCLACYRKVSGEYACSKCGWPVCGTQCENNIVHSNQECRLFQEKGLKVDSSKFKYSEEESMYSVISPIRGLLLQRTDPHRWDLVWSLMSHNESRRKQEYWTEKHTTIIRLIRERLGLTEYSEEMIDTVLGIFLVNDFEINNNVTAEEFSSTQKSTLRGLYSIASIPNHSCLCNTSHTFQPNNNYRMIVRASRKIKKNEDITHTYVDPLEPLLIRQELLNLGKFFHCQCVRCSDPTELKTFSSAMICPACKKGFLLSRDVSTVRADWSCNKCEHSIPSEKISRICNAIKVKSEELEYNASTPENCNIPAHEAFLKKYGQVLHSNHVLMVMVKYWLAKMYGRMDGYQAHQLSDEQFKRKQQLCQEVLQVFDQIMPGNNRMRGVILYELHLPLVMLANRQLQRGPGSADPKAIKNGLKSGLESLKQGLAILESEPEGSFESKIVAGSRESVAELETFWQTISKAI